MVETSVVFNTFIWTFMIGALYTDMYWGRFDLFGPYPRRPLQDKSQDRWPKTDEKKPEI